MIDRKRFRIIETSSVKDTNIKISERFKVIQDPRVEGSFLIIDEGSYEIKMLDMRTNKI